MLNIRSVISLITAPAGSGKTYAIVRYLATEVLPHSQAVIYSNLPLNVEEIARFVAPDNTERQADIADRLRPLPKEILDSWNTCQSGPIDYFQQTNDQDKPLHPLEGAYIILDEAQYYVGNAVVPPDRKSERSYLARWSKFLGELRHDGARIWLISQTTQKLGKFVRDEAGTRMYIIDQERELDPILRIPIGDWLELAASWTGRYVSWIKLQVKDNTDGAWELKDERQYIRDPKYFCLYNSFAARQDGKGGSSGPQHEFLKRGKIGMAWWFLRRNFLGALPHFLKITAVLSMPLWIPYAFGAVTKTFTPKMNKVEAAKPLAATTQLGGDLVSADLPGGVQNPKEGTAGSTQQREEITKLQADLKQARQQLDLAEKSRQQLQDQLDKAFELKLVTFDTVTFSSGDTYKIGETIEWGPYKGRRVASVNWRNLSANLDNGVTLRMADR